MLAQLFVTVGEHTISSLMLLFNVVGRMLLRKSAEIKSVAGRHLDEKLHLLFKEIVKFNGKEKNK